MEDSTTGNANLPTRDKTGNTEGEAAIKKAVNPEEKGRASRMKSGLCNIRLILEDTKSVVRDMETTLTASITEIFDELMIVKAKVDETIMLDATLRIAVGCERTKAAARERERHVAVVEAGIKERELKRWQTAAQDERKNLQRETWESVTTMAIDKQKLLVERAELKQENARLECELDTARTALQAEKAIDTIEIADALIGKSTMEGKLASAERDRNAAALTLAQQRSQIIEKSNDIVEMHRYIDNVTSQKRKLAEELLKMKDEAAQNKKVMDVNLTFLDQTEGEKRKLEDELLVLEKKVIENKKSTDQTQGEKRKLEDELLVMKKKVIENKKSTQEAHEKALGMATSECKKLQQNLLGSEKERLTLQDKLFSAGKEAIDNKRRMEVNQAQLEQAKGDCKRVRDQLHQVGRNLVGMEAKFVTSDTKFSTLKVEKIFLEKECQSIQSALCKEQEKSLCEICMESQKDTICLPCLHLRYCFGCLEKHRERARTCPFCRTIISGVLRSDIGMCGS